MCQELSIDKLILKIKKVSTVTNPVPAFSYQRQIDSVDPEMWLAFEKERRRQEEHIELIASENYASPAVMQAQGSHLTNKYAEGYPGKKILRWL